MALATCAAVWKPAGSLSAVQSAIAQRQGGVQWDLGSRMSAGPWSPFDLR